MAGIAPKTINRLSSVVYLVMPNKSLDLNRWQSAWRQLGASTASEELYHQLVACYSEPHRKYHTIQHLNECLTHLESVRALEDHADEVELALWFHDAIYDTSKKDNEKRSAEWARDSVLAAGVSSEKADRIHELIMATMHNAVPVGRDAEVLVDIDLGILGAGADRFDDYEVQVREEYSWVPESLYRAARTQVLQQFMNREWIYSTELFRTKYEARARENLARSLARLHVD
jgi:predicted metal-dependent HD superfamily phosphohydrolase